MLQLFSCTFKLRWSGSSGTRTAALCALVRRTVCVVLSMGSDSLLSLVRFIHLTLEFGTALFVVGEERKVAQCFNCVRVKSLAWYHTRRAVQGE